MKTLPIILTGILSLFIVSSAFAGHEGKTEKAALSQLMKAISDNDYDTFLSNGTPEFKKNVSKQAFDSVTGQLGQLIRAGYTTEYVSKLYQKGVIVHLWKISYVNSKENSLAKLIMIDGKVAGFWLL